MTEPSDPRPRVNLRELRDRLAAYVHRAEAGEVFVVTWHGREIAVLGPLETRNTKETG